MSDKTAPETFFAQPQMPDRIVVCAANRSKTTGDVVIGVRHYDALMRKQITNYPPSDQVEQGFIDQRGVFMNRQEAWKVAEAAGQIRRRVGGDTYEGGTLYSENLY